MIIKNVHLFYFSPTYTTKKTVKAIAEGLSTGFIEHDLTFSFESEEEFFLQEDEIAIVGVPVYGGRTPVITRDMLKKIHGNNSLAVAVTVYGNRDYDDALLELKDILSENGFSVIAGGAFIGEHSYSRKVGTKRPDDEDITKAIAFGKEIRKKIDTDTYTKNIEVKGNFPYREDMPVKVFSPMSNKNCIYCRKCYIVCPVGAIDKKDPELVDVEKCIHCYACVKVCTFNGREIPDNPLKNIIEFLETKCSERKEPEIFI
ncbi:4Fe-4S dicluster domain-containing protein [Fusobacterium varium]|uniref:EFR1 family ferrodoxin n=1 Tax=Fusobacterium varium TaxID=856 RepID=UPI000E4B1E9F|nr:EFR1 family ferrodoxin [Fusobacterium varium]RHG34410.1 4Fe-4S dicluster domain-containing protein [Fusobacterium varium]